MASRRQEEPDPDDGGPADCAQPTEALHVEQRNTGQNKHGKQSHLE